MGVQPKASILKMIGRRSKRCRISRSVFLRCERGKHHEKIVIVAAWPAASCAARLRRLDETAEIVLLERGEYISYANCGLPYYVGDAIKSRDALLVQRPRA